ncbi:MAG: transporter, ATP-binding protein [Gammaproteobacteria bacterium]|jgi:ATP-binding cassette subfamily B protein|nr:transporter, ATP-binding protein [Gammaproteobacteria bacterium]
MQPSLPTALFPFIWHFLRQYKFKVSIYVIFALAAGFWGPFNSLLIKEVINRLPNAASGDISILMLPASLIVLNFIIFDNLTWRGITYIRAKYLPVIINCVIAEVMDHCLSKAPQFYHENLSGKISRHISNLADGIESLGSNVAPNFLRGASLLLAAFITAYFVNPIFCLILILWFIPFAAVSIKMSQKLVLLSDKQASAESIVVGEVVDALSNHNNIRIFSRKAAERSRMSSFLETQQKAYTATTIYSIVIYSVQGTLIAIMMALAAYFLIYLYGKHLVTVGDFALILGLCMETAHMVWFTMTQVDEFNKAVGRCKQSLISLMMPVEIQDKPNARILHCNQGHITFENVTFHYKGTTPLFQNKSVNIPAKQKVGLVGYSGSGKTTFVNLILRLYEINEGAILIDGQNIEELTQDSLRLNIAIIPQEPTLFHRSLMENIRYGRIEATDEEVIEAAKKAHAHDFIVKLPQGYESLAGERGVKLSGGQRQRIAMARAILKNAPILILDEATSQLDSLTEHLLQQSLWELMGDRTTLVIAHRLSTLLYMNRILVFDKGKIVEDGAHAELLAKKGLYKQLWEAQIGGFLPDKKSEGEIIS